VTYTCISLTSAGRNRRIAVQTSSCKYFPQASVENTQRTEGVLEWYGFSFLKYCLLSTVVLGICCYIYKSFLHYVIVKIIPSIIFLYYLPPYSWNSFTGLMFPFSYMSTQYFHPIHPHNHLLIILPAPNVTDRETRPGFLSCVVFFISLYVCVWWDWVCFLLLKKNDIFLFKIGL
jgi:hypothetical protein